ncbi:hypothetical protein ABW20_dc0102380 [Dactylellina cionopaga]|nr:hypothetical protein ABW20_dc0102380 [Dactylellina cionopaga]
MYTGLTRECGWFGKLISASEKLATGASKVPRDRPITITINGPPTATASVAVQSIQTDVLPMELPAGMGILPPGVTGIDPAAFKERPTDKPLAFGASFVGNNKLTYSIDRGRLRRTKSAKADLAAAIIVILVITGLGICALFCYRRRKKMKARARAGEEGNPQSAEPIMTESIEPGERGQFRVRMPQPAPGSFQKHGHGVRRAEPVYMQHNRRVRRSGSGSDCSQVEESRAAPPLSAARVRYYCRDHNGGKLVKSGPSR